MTCLSCCPVLVVASSCQVQTWGPGAQMTDTGERGKEITKIHPASAHCHIQCLTNHLGPPPHKFRSFKFEGFEFCLLCCFNLIRVACFFVIPNSGLCCKRLLETKPLPQGYVVFIPMIFAVVATYFPEDLGVLSKDVLRI